MEDRPAGADVAVHRPRRPAPRLLRGVAIATFSQWHAGRKITPVIWACGPEEVLAAEVIAEYRRSFSVLPVTILDAALTTAYMAWDEIMSRPGDGRLLIVHGAEQIVPSPVLAVALSEASLAYPVVFTTVSLEFSRKDGEHLGQLLDSKSAQVIRCVRPSREEDILSLMVSWWPALSPAQAGQVLDRCGGSLQLAREACEKGSLAAVDPRFNVVVCRKEEDTGFSDMVVAGDRRHAATAACTVPAESIPGTLKLLASRLSTLALLRAAVQDGMTPREQAAKLKADPYLLRLLRPHAREYTPSREAQCREVLAMAEQAALSGAREGVLEAVALLW